MRRAKHKRTKAASSASAVGPPPAAITLTEEQRAKLRATYDREREHLCTASLDVSGRYDQWIVTLPGGALILSLGFLEKIAPNPLAATRIWIAWAWGFLILSLGSAVGSLFSSMAAHDNQINILDTHYTEDDSGIPRSNLTNAASDLTRWLNRIAFSSLLIGMILLCVFAFKNLPASRNNSQATDSGQKPQETVMENIEKTALNNGRVPPSNAIVSRPLPSNQTAIIGPATPLSPTPEKSTPKAQQQSEKEN